MVSVIIGAVSVVILLIGLLGGLYWKIAENKTDLNAEIHKESKEILGRVNANTIAIGKLEGEVSGIKRQVESMDRKLDRVLETRQGEAPPADPSVKHSQRR